MSSPVRSCLRAGSTIVLPAGSYRVGIGGGWKPFTVAEGEKLTISVT
jgi:hypothetical protein